MASVNFKHTHFNHSAQNITQTQRLLSFHRVCCRVFSWTCRHQRCMKSESLEVNCSTMALFTVQDPLGFTVAIQSLCSGLHRHLLADICTEQRGQLELQPKFWLCSCQLERKRHREIQVCLLQFSFYPKITVDAHISDVMSRCTIPDSPTFFNTEIWLKVKIKCMTDGTGHILCHLESKNVIPLCPIFDKASVAW